MPSCSHSAAASGIADGAVRWLLACTGTANAAVPAHWPATCTDTTCKVFQGDSDIVDKNLPD